MFRYHSASNVFARLSWRVVWVLLFRPSPDVFQFWRRFLLKVFGANVGPGSHIYPSVRIWAPWNLELGRGACLGRFVDCYNVAPVFVGVGATVSQYSYLCTASHDYTDASFPLKSSPIRIEAKAWVASDVFVGPGVQVGEGAVVGARSSVFRDIPPWTVAVGSPARAIRHRLGANSIVTGSAH